MISKPTYHRYLWVAMILLLAACGTVLPQQTAMPTATSAPTLTPVLETPTALPTSSPTPTQTPLPLVTVDGLRVVYIRSLTKGRQYGGQGNLYVQDSGGQPVQLTHSGLDRAPLFSDDGRKIVFFRGDASDLPTNPSYSIYSINADGSQEQALVTSDILAALGLGYDKYTGPFYGEHIIAPIAVVFIPGTHQLLFGTQQNSAKLLNDKPNPNFDLLLVDTDSAKIKRLLAPGQGGGQLSPNRKLMAVDTVTGFTSTGTAPGSVSVTLVPAMTQDINTNYWADSIDVIGINGQVVRHNLVTSPPALENIYRIELPAYWTQDSNQLIVVPPIPTSEIPQNTGDPVLRSVWRYSLDGKPGVRIPLNPPVVGDAYRVSPDGNWIVYSFHITDTSVETWDPAFAAGVYLGNLRTGASQRLDVPGLRELPTYYDDWSPDNTHFIFRDFRDQMYMGNIHGETAQLTTGVFRGWLDASRYLYGNSAMGEIGKEAKIRVVQLPTDVSYLAFVVVKH